METRADMRLRERQEDHKNPRWKTGGEKRRGHIKKTREALMRRRRNLGNALSREQDWKILENLHNYNWSTCYSSLAVRVQRCWEEDPGRLRNHIGPLLCRLELILSQVTKPCDPLAQWGGLCLVRHTLLAVFPNPRYRGMAEASMRLIGGKIQTRNGRDVLYFLAPGAELEFLYLLSTLGHWAAKFNVQNASSHCFTATGGSALRCWTVLEEEAQLRKVVEIVKQWECIARMNGKKGLGSMVMDWLKEEARQLSQVHRDVLGIQEWGIVPVKEASELSQVQRDVLEIQEYGVVPMEE